PLMAAPDALGAHTFGFGQQLAIATQHQGVRWIVATLGGSASTDGGLRTLAALGARWLDDGPELASRGVRISSGSLPPPG
ncbi:MAG: glycerate kinase, partial [Dermatophilaceae bacterium]